jgi:hypothetical protein
MKKKLILFILLFHGLICLASAEENFDFMVRIFDTKGGERTAGTISVKIKDLKDNKAKLGQTFTHHIKNTDRYTGIEIEWHRSESGNEIFNGVIHQSDGNISEKGIKIQFKYDEKAKIIYTNRFHTIKIIPSKET